MKTSEQIARELADLIQRHYYSEDFELHAAFRAYAGLLSADDRERLRYVVMRRLSDSDSLVDVILCTEFDVPECVSSLVRMLDRQTGTSQITRALMGALSRYGGLEAFRAVERFMDSDQEHEALASLARIDFARALPYLVRSLAKDRFLDACLHIFHARKQAAGFHGLLEDLRSGGAFGSPVVRERLRLSLTAKKGEYNPFTEQELRALLAALDVAE